MTRYQHLATLLAERIEQGLYRHGEKLPSVRSLARARRQHQHRAAGVSDAGDDEAHHPTAAFGLFCRTT